MNQIAIPRHAQRGRENTACFRLTPIMRGILLSGVVVCSGPSYAADEAATIAELKAENEKQRREIEALKQMLLKSQSGGAAANSTAVAGTQAVQAQEAGVATTQAPAREENAKAPETVAATGEEEKDTTLGEVVVKRQSPLEKLKDTPKSVSVVTGAELEKFQANNFQSIVQKIGNVGMTIGNPQTASTFIRGVGVTGKLNGLDPSVGVSIDGVSYATSAMVSSFSYVDLATVDVTRGPTGTLGGKNANLGQINITTKAPGFTPEAYGSIAYGDFNTLITRGALGGAVLDNLLAWRGSFYREQSDSYLYNKYDPDYAYRNKDRTYGRIQFLLTPTDNFSARVSMDYTPRAKEGSDNASTFPTPTPNYYDTGRPVDQTNEAAGKLSRRWFGQEPNYSPSQYLSNEINIANQRYTYYGTKGGSLNLSWDVADHNLASITGYKDYYFSSGGAGDNPFDVSRPPASGQVDNYQFSQELNVSSKPGGFVDYKAGVYLLKVKVPSRTNLTRFGSDAGAFRATTAQYNILDPLNNGADTPLNRSLSVTGRGLLLNSVDRLSTKLKEEYDNESGAIFGHATWHPIEPLTIATGLRLTHEQRTSTAASRVLDNGFGAELNPVSKNDVKLGGFASNSNSGALIAGQNNAAQLALADFVARKYFGVASYGSLSTDQKKQVAAAKSIRNSALGTLFQTTEAEPFNDLLKSWNIGPSWKFNERQTAYFSWQHGEKAGVSQIIGATVLGGKSVPNKAETSDAYELGLKSVLLDRTLVVNADIYLNDITDYIQPMLFEDKVQTAINNDGKTAYTSGLGNVPKVQSKGVEFDLTYTGLQYTTFRLAGAYTDARYEDFKFLAKPAELNDGTGVAYYDASGKTLPYASKFSANLYAEYARPLPFADTLQFHTNVNYRYQSRFNTDQSLSRYAWKDSLGTTDFAIGIGRRDRLFDANLIIKNVFDQDTSYTPSWNTY
ncbi:TonB-dependent receptor [Methylococcus sp. EFPC2]|uniref:TonB-dependent receptor n=1 Tax=Methylococcus sp. EFPC2 TaxID=2812648 RepID=UPI001967E5DC|nr:TonB-dependent receptor [Methylococcus sp. EFPC2]QSA97384.1 TonB-dependent receptor [Methylococcus sp. EFPC2]